VLLQPLGLPYWNLKYYVTENLTKDSKHTGVIILNMFFPICICLCHIIHFYIHYDLTNKALVSIFGFSSFSVFVILGNISCDNKDIQIPSKHNKIYYTLPLSGYMFRLLRIIIRPSNELTQDYLIPSALLDPVALIIVGAIILWVHICYYSAYGYLCYYVTMLQVYKPIKYLLVKKMLVYGAGEHFFNQQIFYRLIDLKHCNIVT